MSWFFNAGQVKVSDAESALKERKEEHLSRYVLDDATEQDIDTAIKYVGSVCATINAEYVAVTVSGHRGQGSNDLTSVHASVSAVAAPSGPEPAPSEEPST